MYSKKHSDNICIYHANCTDGFGAALAVSLALDGDVSMWYGIYDEPPPNVEGLNVYIVDFSYPLDVLKTILDHARHVTLIDHHSSAAKAIANFEHPKLTKVIDMNHSGAVLTWLHMHPGTEVPQVLLHVEDRDLWRFDLTGTREIVTAVYSYPYDLSVWAELVAKPERLYSEGVTLCRMHDKLVNIAIRNRRRMTIGGCEVWAVNCDPSLASDVGHEMGKGENLFTASYFDCTSYRQFSLRSPPYGMDVTEIAIQYGGGGHPHASGFRVPLTSLQELGLQ